MDKLTISRIMVQNKYLLSVTKADTGVYVVDIPKAAGLLNDLIQQKLQQTQCYTMLPLSEQYAAWIKETKRNGGVLIGSSIREFFKWVEDRNKEVFSGNVV